MKTPNDVLTNFYSSLTEGFCLFNSSGDFVFAISSADGSELWLSTDDDPHNSRKIAYLGDVRLINVQLT